MQAIRHWQLNNLHSQANLQSGDHQTLVDKMPHQQPGMHRLQQPLPLISGMPCDKHLHQVLCAALVQSLRVLTLALQSDLVVVTFDTVTSRLQ